MFTKNSCWYWKRATKSFGNDIKNDLTFSEITSETENKI